MTNQIYIIPMMYINYITITLSRGNDMKTTTQELKQYITRLFQLSNSETWECEALEEAGKYSTGTFY